MNPESRMIWTLGGALAMWSPVALGMFAGKVDVAIGGLEFLGALAFAYIGTGIVGAITKGYRSTAEHAERLKRQIEQIEQRTTVPDQLAKSAPPAAATDDEDDDVPRRRRYDDDED